MATALQLKRLPVDDLVFPESPRWRDGRLWLSDMWGDEIVSVDERGEVVFRLAVDGLRGIEFLPDGTLLFGTKTSGTLYGFADGAVRELADLCEFSTRGLNDLVVDRHGRTYVDAYRAGPGLPAGSVVLVRPDGSVQEVAPDLATPNGLAITADGGTLIVAQTGANELTAFTIGADGSLADRRVFARLEGRPDGICLDAEGAVWVGLFEDEKYVRVRHGGEVTDVVPIPGSSTAAVLLGGEDRRTLFLCASALDPDERTRSKGSVYSLRVAVPGAGLPWSTPAAGRRAARCSA